MYTIYKKGSPNKRRDIDIAIAYHNTGKTLKEVGKRYNISSGRAGQIHYCILRHVLRCLDKWKGHGEYLKMAHCDEKANYLKDYKKFLTIC